MKVVGDLLVAEELAHKLGLAKSDAVPTRTADPVTRYKQRRRAKKRQRLERKARERAEREKGWS